MFEKSARIYDTIYKFKDYAAEADLVTRYIRASAPDAATLLDVACGTGLHLDPELLAGRRPRGRRLVHSRRP